MVAALACQTAGAKEALDPRAENLPRWVLGLRAGDALEGNGCSKTTPVCFGDVAAGKERNRRGRESKYSGGIIRLTLTSSGYNGAELTLPSTLYMPFRCQDKTLASECLLVRFGGPFSQPSHRSGDATNGSI